MSKKKLSQREMARRQAQADKANGVKYFIDEDGRLMKIGPVGKMNGVKASSIRPVNVGTSGHIDYQEVNHTIAGNEAIIEYSVTDEPEHPEGVFLQASEKTKNGPY